MIILLILLVFCLFPIPALAESINIKCDEDGCYQENTNWSLSDSHIYPGWSKSENLWLHNDRKDDCIVSMLVSPEGEFLPLGESVAMTLTEEDSIVWGGHLDEVLNLPVTIGALGAKNSREIFLTLSLDQSTDQSHQNLMANFGFDFNFVCTPVDRITNPEEGIIINEYLPHPLSGNKEWVEIKNINNYPVMLAGWKVYDSINNKTTVSVALEPGEVKVVENNSPFFNNGEPDKVRLFSNKDKLMDWSSYSDTKAGLSFSRQLNGNFCLTQPSPGEENKDCEGESENGVVLGASVSISDPVNQNPQCQDGKPQGVPGNLRALAGNNRVTLSWTESEGPLNYYLVTFGDDPGASDYGNPNIGGAGTTSYTVSNLQSGRTYYFKVRAGNGCSPGDFSEVVSVVVGGSVLETEGVPSGFQPGVLGESTQVPNTQDNENLNQKTEDGKVMGVKTAEIFKPWMIWVILGLLVLRLLIEIVKPKRG